LTDLKSGAELENVRGTDLMKNRVLHRVKNERNILHRIKPWKANWTGHTLCRNCLLKHVAEGKRGEEIEGKGK